MLLKKVLRQLWGNHIFGSRSFCEGVVRLDVVLVVNEAVEECKGLNKDGLIFSVNFEKSYGHVY